MCPASSTVSGDVLVKISGQQAQRTIVEVGGQGGAGSVNDRGLHNLANLLITIKDKLVLMHSGNEQKGCQ